MLRNDIYKKIDKERDRQDELYREKNANLKPLAHKWLTLEMEELGEAAMCLDYIDGETNEYERGVLVAHYKSELIQVAALVVQHLERLEEYG